MQNDKNHDDFDLESFSTDDGFDNLFDESMDDFKLPDDADEKNPKNVKTPAASEKKPVPDAFTFDAIDEPDIFQTKVSVPKAGSEPQKRKRTISDFEPDMDALLLTAQSSLIIEGMGYYNNKNYSSENLQIYIEALKGVDLYTKILNRNPANYRKLKTLIDADPDCQQVENIAFDLYKNEYDTTPDSDKEKLEAFELFKKIFRKAVNKASINKSMKIIKKYFLLSGGVDIEKIHESINNGNLEIKRDVTNFQQHLKLSLEMLKKGDTEITKGLRGRDLNVYITKTSEFLGHYYKMLENIKVSDYFFRIHSIYSKYFIMK